MLQMLAVPLAMAAGGYMLDKQMGGDGTKGAVMGGAAGAGKGPAGAAAGAGGTTAKVGSSMMMNPLIQNPAMANTLSSAGAITPNFADKALNFATTAPDNLANYVSDGFKGMSFADKLTLGLTGASAIPDNSQQLMPVQNSMVASKGPYQPSLLETTVPGMQTAQKELTDEEKLLLMQQNNSLLG
jgi:hypothetical protein